MLGSRRPILTFSNVRPLAFAATLSLLCTVSGPAAGRAREAH